MSLKVLNDNNFQEVITNSDIPVAIDFWAPWCGPCKALTPIFESLSTELSGVADFYKLNVDESPTIASTYSIMSIPTVLIFKNGKIEKQIIGLVSKSKLKNYIENI